LANIKRDTPRTQHIYDDPDHMHHKLTQMQHKMKQMNWNEWIQHFYYGALYAWYGLYVIALMGIATAAPMYLSMLNDVLKYFIIGFLLVRFNPWTRQKSEPFTAFDRSIVFSAAFFLLASTAIVSFVQSWLHLPNTL
jgi:hypothetical protein